MKKVMAIVLLLTCTLGLVSCGNGKSIGEISGAENEYTTIDDVTYVQDDSSNFRIKDRGKYLGQVSNSKITMKVYSVDGNADGKYIYALWDWAGAFYARQE